MVDQTASVQWLPNREQLSVLYEKYDPSFRIVLDRLLSRLRECIVISSVPTYKARVKSFNSYYRKLLRNCVYTEYDRDDLPVITDILGIRIICSFLQDLSLVEKSLQNCFSIFEVERKGADRTFREFGYESTHILLAIPEDMKQGLDLPKELIFEIQVRTILQDAWAEVEHELVYKSEFSPFDLPLKRKLASINASLSLADIIFQEIRDYQNKLNRELDKRRGSFYKQADLETEFDKSSNQVGIETAAATHEAGSLSYVQGTIDDMILDAIEAHNNGRLDRAVLIYSCIIDAKPNDVILSVIYKHRGMAYFAQSMYEEALSDFRASAEAKPDNFRAYYYIGIVLSVIGKDNEALEQYSISLQLNPFQPYVYYRKAHSFYNLGMYTEALIDLDKAVSLGFKKDEEKRLRMLIANKIDII